MGWLGRKSKEGRPPLPDLPPSAPGASLEDALELRGSGDLAGARAVLREIDRGKGLRTVLRAAAALEAGDEAELAPLLPCLALAEPAWLLPLQVAAALEKGDLRQEQLDLAEARKAPAWALSWAGAMSEDDADRRRSMVDLLFADPALARTVAARDWKVQGAADDKRAVERYATLSHGRDLIRRFGASAVAGVLLRAEGGRR